MKASGQHVVVRYDKAKLSAAGRNDSWHLYHSGWPGISTEQRERSSRAACFSSVPLLIRLLLQARCNSEPRCCDAGPHIHCRLSHPQVVWLFVALEDTRHIYMVLELAEGGDLRRHLGATAEHRVRKFIADGTGFRT